MNGGDMEVGMNVTAVSERERVRNAMREERGRDRGWQRAREEQRIRRREEGDSVVGVEVLVGVVGMAVDDVGGKVEKNEGG